ncbi:MAG: hypothetical protein LBU79_04390, partial [Planctomycetota bacterium]|nr:hypothetical protein [Planctomycetota bacterium]
AINAHSPRPDAAWLFIQYFTSRDYQLRSVKGGKCLNPPRRSVFEDQVFQERLRFMDGYAQVFQALMENSRIFFTPTPYFFAIVSRWADTLHGIADKRFPSVQAGLDDLKAWMDQRLADLVVE